MFPLGNIRQPLIAGDLHQLVRSTVAKVRSGRRTASPAEGVTQTIVDEMAIDMQCRAIRANKDDDQILSNSVVGTAIAPPPRPYPALASPRWRSSRRPWPHRSDRRSAGG
jgi:hypothetical protein